MSYFVLFARGVAEFKAGNNTQAELYLGKALQYANTVEDKGSLFWAYFFHASLMSNKEAAACPSNCHEKDFEMTLSDLDAALAIARIDKDSYIDVLILIMRGYTYMGAQMYPQAIADLSEAISKEQTYFPSDPAIYDVDYFYRGETYILEGDYTQGIVDLNISFQHHEPDAYKLSLRGYAYQLNNQCDLAIKDYLDAIQLNDKSNSLEEDKKGIVYWGLAVCLGRVGNYDQAIQLLQKFSTNDPTKIAIQIGAMKIRQKHYQEALNEFDKALAINPKSVFAIYQRGVVYYEQGQYQTAINEFNRALDIDFNDLMKFNGRALCYYKLKKEEQSLADFDKAIAIDANYPTAGIRIGYQVTNDEADDVDYEPDAVLFLINTGRWQPGIIATNNMLKSAKNDKEKAGLIGIHGWIYYEGGLYNEALVDLNNAILLDNTLADAYLYRAETYIALNMNPQQTIEDLEEYLMLNPNSPEKDRVLNMIMQLDQ